MTPQLSLFDATVTVLKPRRPRIDPDALFAEAIRLEEAANPEQAQQVYTDILASVPEHPEALINLGTIHYKASRLSDAEACYRKAILICPGYALAWFDLANCLEESARFKDAIECYLKALHFAPTYADAHYNLALCYEKERQQGRALQHWRAYLKLDHAGPWHSHASHRISAIVQDSSLAIVWRNPLPVPPRTPRREL